MAVFVPQVGTQWVFVAFWWADFIGGLVFTFRGRKGLGGFNTVSATTYTLFSWALWFFFSPVSEYIYLFDKDRDPYNSAPYMQWVCMNLRMMALSFGTLYLSSLVFSRKHVTRRTSRFFSYFLFLIGFMSILIVVVWKPEVSGGTGRTPSHLIPILQDWIYVGVALVMFLIFAVVISKYRFPYDILDGGYENRDDYDDKYRDSQTHGKRVITMITAAWGAILTLILSYAIIIISHKGQFLFSGSLMYYFMTEYWIERVAPYYAILFYIALMLVYWTIYRMDKASRRLRLQDGPTGEESFFAMF